MDGGQSGQQSARCGPRDRDPRWEKIAACVPHDHDIAAVDGADIDDGVVDDKLAPEKASHRSTAGAW